MKHVARIVLFTLSLYIVTHIVAFSMLPLALVLSELGRMSELQRLKVRFAKTVFQIVGQEIHISGLEHINPETRHLIIANYPSGYALFALILLSPNASFVAHEFISRIPLLGQVMKKFGTVFVNAERPIKAFHDIDKALEKGVSNDIIIMPEGQRSSDGKIRPFKRGFVYILRHTGLDLLPVSLNGFYKLKPANRIYLNPDTKLEISIHDPISNEMVKEMSDGELIELVEGVIKGQYKP
jgi:1-acyl-sn-glycerol-3-phosphate acyltransferase